jgi:hypothetical protein
MQMMTALSRRSTVTLIRGMLLLALLLGLVGLGAELLFLAHDESAAQIIAPALVAVALAVTIWHIVQGGPASVRALQFTMALFLLAGVLGIGFHYAANVEFQREMDPSIHGMALFWKAMAAKAPPALAPGSMTQLGLLGLTYAFRHPALGHPGHGRRRRVPNDDRMSGRLDKGDSI